MRLRSLIAVLLTAALMGFVCPAFAENETDLASALTFHSQDGSNYHQRHSGNRPGSCSGKPDTAVSSQPGI